MSVRGTTHARHHKKVIIREGEADGDKISCAWLDCDDDGYHFYRVRVNYGTNQTRTQPLNTWYVFCSERHRQFFINSHRDNKNLPPGYKASIL